MNTLFFLTFEIFICFSEVSLLFYYNILHQRKLKETITENSAYDWMNGLCDMIADRLSFFIPALIVFTAARELMYQHSYRCMHIIAYLLLSILLIFIFTRNKKYDFLLSKWILLFFFLLNFIGVIAVEAMLGLGINLNGKNTKSLYIMYLIITFFLFFLTSMILLITHIGHLYHKHLNLIKLEKQQMIENSISDSIPEITDKLHAWKHDSQNHLMLLNSFILHKKYKEAENYICDLLESYEISRWGVYSGNSIIDAVISVKSLSMKRKNIQFNYTGFTPEKIPISNVALSSLLGNLLDNALEAVEKVPKDDERYINLETKIIRDNLFITVANSCTGKYLFKKDHSLKSLKNSIEHGYGLKIIKTIADESNGVCFFEPSAKEFTAIISFPL